MPRPPKGEKSLFTNQDGIHYDVPMSDAYGNPLMMIDPQDPSIPTAANYWLVNHPSQDMAMAQYAMGGVGSLAYQNPVFPPIPPQQPMPQQMPPMMPQQMPPMMPQQYPPVSYPQMPYPSVPPPAPMYPPSYPTPIPQYYPVPYPAQPQMIPQPYPVYIRS